MLERSILDFDFMVHSIPRIARGIPVSLAIAAVAFFFGALIGLGIALIRIRRIPVLTRVAGVYTSFMRGTPLLAQIFLCYYGIPLVLRYLNDVYAWNLNISAIPAIVFMYFSFSLNVGAYLSESIRAALLSVPPGQIEAASSLGMTDFQAFLRITLPQAALVALPNMGNTFIALLKDTSLAFAASVPEIIGQAKISAARSSNFLEAYLVAALLYWIICFALERLLNMSERRLRRHERKTP
ncbi:MAG: amino acid ABC transporter permease [Treponema sp.]|jgi:L-cystine transport system permease protein|nr:amino acid ABC transporter permease [Treponema sp.]